MSDITVTPTDTMISLPLPNYVVRKLGRLYRMSYSPHISIVTGTQLPDKDRIESIKEFFTTETAPPRITLRGLSVLPMDQGNNLLWANAEIDPHFEYFVVTEIPDWYRVMNGIELGAHGFPYTPYGFRPHVSLQYRHRPFRWLPKLPEITWVQRWAEIVEGDKVVERIALRKRPEDSEV